MQNPEVSQARPALLQSKITAVSEKLNDLNLAENTVIMAFLKLVKKIYDEDKTQNANEWTTLDAHLERFLTTVIKPLEHNREETENFSIKRIKMFCERWSEAKINMLAPLSHGNFVANDSVANISDLNQRLDVCLTPYSVASTRKSKDVSFFSEAHGVDAKYNTFTAVAGDQRNFYSNSVAWMLLTFAAVFVCLFSLILQHRTIVSSQAADSTTHQKLHGDIEKLGLPVAAQGTEFSLKPPPTIFYGREELVDNITRLILSGDAASDAARIAIMGSGGMGKTSAALAVIHDSRVVDVFGDNRYWVPCDKAHTIPLLLEYLARMLLVSAKSGYLLHDIMLHLRRDNIPRIFLLDNFETLWDSVETKDSSEHILSSLGSIAKNTILLTMRGSVLPLGVQWTKLPRPEIDRLSLKASRDTFKKHNQYYIDDQPDDLDDLLRALDYWPLAISRVARVGHFSKMKPSELLDRWKKEKTTLSNIRPTRLESLDVSIQLSLHSLHSRQMHSNQDALRLLGVLACLPGGITPGHLHDVAPAIHSVDAAKRQLLGASLAEYTPGGALTVLSPIRAYMLRDHPLNASDMLALRNFYFQLVEAGKHDPGTQEFRTAIELLRREDSNIRSVLMNALENETSVDAVRATIHYAHYLYWDVPSTEVLEKAIGLIRKHPSPELDSLMPHCLLRLGMLFRRMDEIPRAVSNLNQAKEGFESLGDLGRTAECCLELATVYMLLAKYPEAINVLDTARNLFQAIDNQRGISD